MNMVNHHSQALLKCKLYDNDCQHAAYPVEIEMFNVKMKQKKVQYIHY